jgi:hypothetical protein
VRPQHVGGETDELGGQGGEPLVLPYGIAVVKEDVLPLTVADLAETVPKGL